MKINKHHPMNHHIKILCLGLLVILSSFSPAFAKDAPASALELVTRVSDAVKAKDTNAFLALINWDGVSDKWKTMFRGMVPGILEQQFTSIELAPLYADFPITNELNGVRYTPNLRPLGLV